MEYHISSEMLYAAACLIYIFSGIFCGIIRWLHMCKPYDEDGEFFYPGRKQVTFFFLSIILQFPYLLNPMDTDTWMYIRVFGIIYYPVCFSLTFKRFFRRERLKHNNKKSIYFAVPFAVIGVLLLLTLFYKGNLISTNAPVFMCAMGLFSVLLTVGYFQVARHISKYIKDLNEENYSNEDDFPYFFAKKVFFTPIFWITAMWIIFLTGNHWVKFLVDISCAFWMVGFLSIILHPQQFFSNISKKAKQDKMKQQIGDIVKEFIIDKEGDTEENITDDVQNPDFSQEVQIEVITVLLRRFKEQHLQKADVLKDISLGNKKEASRFIAATGYYNLVNTIRLKYAEYYTQQNPRATKDEIALESGFSTRSRLYEVRNKGIVIDSKLLEDIKFD